VRSLGGLDPAPDHHGDHGRPRRGDRRAPQLLADDRAQLVTLTGPGGSGKTRLAVATAESLVGAYPGGVYFVALETVTSADVMWTAIADGLGLPTTTAAPHALVDQLAEHRTLLVLDNLEQLPAAAEVVHELLTAPASRCSRPRGVRCTCTASSSTRCLRSTLPPPDVRDVAQLGEAARVQLFVQRARLSARIRARADNADDIAEICRMLDGLPLAVELAASRVKLLGTRALRTRRSAGFWNMLAAQQAERPTRQQTLRNAAPGATRLAGPLSSKRVLPAARRSLRPGPFDLDRGVPRFAADRR
jgi:predicted ATPase